LPKAKKIERRDKASALMRGIFSNLLWEAERMQEYHGQLSSCSSCTHVFDLRDTRHAVVDGHHYCPACNIEAERGLSD